jgi:hypothetical protein
MLCLPRERWSRCEYRIRRQIVPAEKHRGILRRWAEHAGLQLASYV